MVVTQGQLLSGLCIVSSRLYFKHYKEFKVIRKSGARDLVRWMMYFSIFTDVLDRLRLLTSASPFSLCDDYLSWIPFYFIMKVIVIIYGSVSLRRASHAIFGKKSDAQQINELDQEKWMKNWVKNYVKWIIFWIIYAIFLSVEWLLEEGNLLESDEWGYISSMALFSTKLWVKISKRLLLLCSGLFTSMLFSKILKPFANDHQMEINDKLDGFEEYVVSSWLFQQMSRKFHWYLKRWKEVKAATKDVRAQVKEAREKKDT